MQVGSPTNITEGHNQVLRALWKIRLQMRSTEGHVLPDNNSSPAIMADNGLLRGRLYQVDTLREKIQI